MNYHSMLMSCAICVSACLPALGEGHWEEFNDTGGETNTDIDASSPGTDTTWSWIRKSGGKIDPGSYTDPDDSTNDNVETFAYVEASNIEEQPDGAISLAEKKIYMVVHRGVRWVEDENCENPEIPTNGDIKIRWAGTCSSPTNGQTDEAARKAYANGGATIWTSCDYQPMSVNASQNQANRWHTGSSSSVRLEKGTSSSNAAIKVSNASTVDPATGFNPGQLAVDFAANLITLGFDNSRNEDGPERVSATSGGGSSSVQFGNANQTAVASINFYGYHEVKVTISGEGDGSFLDIDFDCRMSATASAKCAYIDCWDDSQTE